jgi:hypothetical protein
MYDTIDYPAFIDAAMRGVVLQALRQVQQYGLPENHHFFISFQTDYPGVQISPQLKARYPEEITIVVQHQFWDLQIEPDHFSLMLSFNNIPEKLLVPLDALTAFADPSIKFGLQFHGKQSADGQAPANTQDEKVACPATGKKGKDKPALTSFDEDETAEEKPVANDEKVISLETFRKR